MQKVKPDDRKYLLLIEKIEQIFTYGFVLSDDIMYYIDSTFLSPSINELEEFLESEDFKKKDEEKASGFEELLNKNNMETLISRGVRIPYISKEDAIHSIVIIDTIILAVCGKQYNLKY
ncbi:MAG TPA: hypothetical protein VMW44_00510 [Candidatus Bathyarchaeia archaeon]|nr:hypothetical protein [Candidatus Bathyarchaeia archaeon]